MKEQRPLYVVGVGRSGTSLLQSILGTHSTIKSIPETSFLRRVIFGGRINDLKDDKYLDRIPKFKSKVLASEKNQRKLLGVYVEMVSSSYKYTLDKDPRLIEFYPLINTFIKGAKIIQIYRDPRDVLASKKNAQWSSGRSLLSYLISSRVQLEDGKRIENNSNVMSIKYEDLITKTEFEVRKICRFLGVPFEVEMLSFQKTAELLVQGDEISWKKETLSPVNSKNSSKWLESLNKIESLSSYLNVKDFCDENGYSKTVTYSFNECIYASLLSKLSKFSSSIYFYYRAYRFKQIQRRLGGN